jgi:hypothetical protein
MLMWCLLHFSLNDWILIIFMKRLKMFEFHSWNLHSCQFNIAIIHIFSIYQLLMQHQSLTCWFHSLSKSLSHLFWLFSCFWIWIAVDLAYKLLDSCLWDFHSSSVRCECTYFTNLSNLVAISVKLMLFFVVIKTAVSFALLSFVLLTADCSWIWVEFIKFCFIKFTFLVSLYWYTWFIKLSIVISWSIYNVLISFLQFITLLIFSLLLALMNLVCF